MSTVKELYDKPGAATYYGLPRRDVVDFLGKSLQQHQFQPESALELTEHTIRKMVGQHFHMRELGTRHNTWKTMNWKQRIIKVGTLGLWKRLFIRQYLFIAEKK